MKKRKRRSVLTRLRRRLWECSQLPIILPAAWLLCRLPRSTVWRLGGILGNLAYACDARGRRIAQANLDLVYRRRLSPRRRIALTRIAYRHATRVVLDIFWFSRHRRQRLDLWCRIEPDLSRAVKAGHGIFATAHVGNWEIAGQALAAIGVPLTSVAKPIGSPGTSALLRKSREATGQEILYHKGAIRGLVRALREKRWVAIIQDQYTDPRQGGCFVDFLGRPAAVSTAAAALSLRMSAPVLVGACLRDARGRYHCRLMTMLSGGGGEDVAGMTQSITDAYTRIIRRFPGQWLWMYKRWNRVPHDGQPGDFPFYARRLPEKTK